MFGIGWAEMLVIAIVLVVVVKPEHLPEVARTLGRAYGKLQRLIYESRLILEKEADEIKRSAQAKGEGPEAGASKPGQPSPPTDMQMAADEVEDELNLRNGKADDE